MIVDVISYISPLILITFQFVFDILTFEGGGGCVEGDNYYEDNYYKLKVKRCRNAINKSLFI